MNTNHSRNPTISALSTDTVHNFRKVPPGPGTALPVIIGKHHRFELENGLKVIVVQNHKLPQVSIQFLLDLPPILQGDKVGYIDFAGEMLLKGSVNYTKSEIDEEIDWMAARLKARSDGLFASFLKKHTARMFELFAEVLLQPVFPESELQKLKTRTISALIAGKEDPDKIANNVASVLCFSDSHPYGEIVTEDSVQRIAIEDCINYYNKYFRPNHGYIAIVGDITLEKARLLVEQYFSSWEPLEADILKPDMPEFPTRKSVNLVDRPNAVQSVVSITHPIDFKHNAKDRMAAAIMNTLLGGFFRSRINANVREDKGYTYGAGSSLAPDSYVGQFSVRGSFGTDVTEAAIQELLFEIERMRVELITTEELELVRASLLGNFARSLEKPQTIANFALNIARHQLPTDYYETYEDRLQNVTKEDVLSAAQKYLQPDCAYILVVGNKLALSDGLGRLDKDGQVNLLDGEGHPIHP